MREVADAVVVYFPAERAKDSSNTGVILGDGNNSKQRFLQLFRLIAWLA